MIGLHSPLPKLLLLLGLGLAALCTLGRPVFATLQELHELGHRVTTTEDGLEGEATAGNGDPSLEGALHAPHCCVHAMALPSASLAALAAPRQAPPRFVPIAPRASPRARLLRPPISA